MIEKNYTIPINEQFDKYDGCPLCALHDKLEEQSLEYIMGAAMMEPNVRVETNKVGFCAKHYDAMLARSNRLSLALLLESYTQELSRLCTPPVEKREQQSRIEKLTLAANGCFICTRVEKTMYKYCENIVYLWQAEPDFRQKFIKQPRYCLNHGALLLKCAAENLRAKSFSAFSEDLFSVMKPEIDRLSSAVSGFCKSFDYRSAGKEFDKLAAENAIAYLTSRQ